MKRFVVAALAALAFAVPAVAQNYPARPIRLIVPFPPGGGTDIVSRLVATELAKQTGWTVVVENKAGAGGMIGLTDAAHAPKDGYEMVMGQVDNVVVAPAVQKNAAIVPSRDLTPVIQVASSPFLFMGAINGKYATLRDWVAAAKAAPGKVTYGTAGYGTFTHLAVEPCRSRAGSRPRRSPTRGRRPRSPIFSAVTSRWRRYRSRRGCRTSRAARFVASR